MTVNEWNEVKEVILTTVGFYKTLKFPFYLYILIAKGIFGIFLI